MLGDVLASLDEQDVEARVRLGETCGKDGAGNAATSNDEVPSYSLGRFCRKCALDIDPERHGLLGWRRCQS